MVVAVFFILVILITAMQIHIFEETANGQDLQLRFMEDWRPVFHATTAFGFVLIAYEAYQFIDSPRKYIA